MLASKEGGISVKKRIFVGILIGLFLFGTVSFGIHAQSPDASNEVLLSWNEVKAQKDQIASLFRYTVGKGSVSWNEETGRVSFTSTGGGNAVIDILGFPDRKLDKLTDFVVEADLYLVEDGTTENALFQLGVFSQERLTSGLFFQYRAYQKKSAQYQCYNALNSSTASSTRAANDPSGAYTSGKKVSVRITVTNTKSSICFNGTDVWTINFSDLKVREGNPFLNLRPKCVLEVENLNVYSAKTEHVRATAVQTSQIDSTGAAPVYHARFVGETDFLGYSEIGFDITAHYIGSDGSKHTQTYTQRVSTVYRSLLATPDNGITVTVEASEGAYFFAVVLANIPADIGQIDFEITPFAQWSDGIRIPGMTKTIRIGNGTVISD